MITKEIVISLIKAIAGFVVYEVRVDKHDLIEFAAEKAAELLYHKSRFT